jgi:hypothetical protein
MIKPAGSRGGAAGILGPPDPRRPGGSMAPEKNTAKARQAAPRQ